MKILTRMGDGSNVELTRDELRTEFEQGSEVAAKKAKIPALTENEVDWLVDMFRGADADLGRAARQRGRHDQGRLRQRPQLLAHVERRDRAGQPRGRRAPLRVDARLRLHGGRPQRLLRQAAALPQGARAGPHGAPAGDHDLPAALRLHAEPGPVLPPRRLLPEPVRPAARAATSPAPGARRKKPSRPACTTASR